MRLYALLLSLCLMGLAACSGDNFPAGTVAVVNGQPVSMRLLNAMHDLTHFRGADAPGGQTVDSLRRQYGLALTSLLARVLVEQELKARGLEVLPESLRAEEARIREDYPGGSVELALLENQMDIQTWRELLHGQLSLERFAGQLADRTAGPGAEEVRKHYEENKQDFFIPASLSLVFFSGPEKEQMERLRQSLLREERSLLPPGVHEQRIAMPQGDVPEQWRKELAALEVGQISPLRFLSGKYHFVQLVEKISEKQMGLVEAYPLIEQLLIEKMVDSAYADWLEEAVKKADIRMSAHLRAEP